KGRTVTFGWVKIALLGNPNTRMDNGHVCDALSGGNVDISTGAIDAACIRNSANKDLVGAVCRIDGTRGIDSAPGSCERKLADYIRKGNRAVSEEAAARGHVTNTPGTTRANYFERGVAGMAVVRNDHVDRAIREDDPIGATLQLAHRCRRKQ